ncbi:MAG: ferritin-like protein [Azospirillaceae bacterium]|nr:ferritin-like protein [Azospirillaceae bacterium]
MDSSDITTLEELKSYLYSAMQLEHATLPPYLVALYSIKPGTNLDATQIIRVVAVEEMLHLTFAANLLNAIGGEPDLTVPGFVPNFPTYLPDGEQEFLVHLAPFSRQTIENFLQIERPSLAPSGVNKLVARREHGPFLHLGTHPRQTTMRYYSIGDFYKAIEDGLVYLEGEAQKQGKTIFTGDAGRQITSQYYYSGGGHLHPVTDLATAVTAIRLVIEQGEGQTATIYDSQKELAHYYRFDQLIHGRYYRSGDAIEHPTGEPVSVDWDAAYPVKTDVKLADIPAGSELHQAAAAFNQAYARFLAEITEAYNGKPHKLMEAVAHMFEFRNAMTVLIRNPLPGSNGLYAGPTFEVSPEAAGAPQAGAESLEVVA